MRFVQQTAPYICILLSYNQIFEFGSCSSNRKFVAFRSTVKQACYNRMHFLSFGSHLSNRKFVAFRSSLEQNGPLPSHALTHAHTSKPHVASMLHMDVHAQARAYEYTYTHNRNQIARLRGGSVHRRHLWLQIVFCENDNENSISELSHA